MPLRIITYYDTTLNKIGWVSFGDCYSVNKRFTIAAFYSHEACVQKSKRQKKKAKIAVFIFSPIHQHLIKVECLSFFKLYWYAQSAYALF